MKIYTILFILMIALTACSGDKHEDTITPEQSPSKTLLTSPAQNEVCITGTVISDTESSITFTWNTSDNTDNYDLVIKNLLTGVITTQNITQTHTTITLPRNTAFSWYVVSKSSKISNTAQSDTWKFYNSGPGVENYIPFPADITSPTFGQVINTTTVNLTWTGSTVNNSSIVNYDVYFGTTNTPPILKSKITDSFVNNIQLTPKTKYYWKVITRDSNGDTSDSGLYQFSTN